MLGYIVTLSLAAVGVLAFVFMDLDAPSVFFSQFLPFVFAVCLVVCFTALVAWVFWQFGVPDSRGNGWFYGGSDGFADYDRSSADSASDSGGSDGD